MLNRTALRSLAEALPPGTALPVPREWLLELLTVATGEHQPAMPDADLTVAQVAQRFDRQPATVRWWCEEGWLPGAYRFRGREWRIPPAGLEAFAAGERTGHAAGARRSAAGVTPLKRLVKRRRPA